MSTHDEDRLSRGLHDRAGDVTGAPIELADVKRSARGIRRRRRAAGGLVAAVVVAIAVPVGLNATGSTRADRPVAPASTSPSVRPSTAAPTPDPTAAPTPTPPGTGGVTPLTARGAATGEPAKITYLRGRTVVTPGGATQDLPAAYDSVYPYRGGWLAVERRDGTPYVVTIDASGAVVSAVPGGDRLAVSADGVEVSWFENGKPGRLVLGDSNGHSDTTTALDVPDAQSAAPVGFVGPGSVLYRVDGAEPSFRVTDFGSHTQRLRDVVNVTAVNQEHGLVGVQTSYNLDDGTSCWAVRTNRGGDAEPKTCDWTIRAFSTDGAHLVGYPSGTDGLGSSSVGILDAGTAEVVADFERQGNGVTVVDDVAWEDDSHVLASLYEAGEWHLVRLGTDGSLQVVDHTPGAVEESPFHFAARP